MIAAIQAKIDTLADALNHAIAEAERSGRLSATVITSWGTGGPQKVQVKVHERSSFELELLDQGIITDGK